MKYDIGQEYWKKQQAAMSLKQRHESQKQLIADLRSGIDELNLLRTDVHNMVINLSEE